MMLAIIIMKNNNVKIALSKRIIINKEQKTVADCFSQRLKLA